MRGPGCWPARSRRSRADVDTLGELPLGGTAVGTGINAPPTFAADRHRVAGRRDRPAAAAEPQPDDPAGRPGRAGRGVGRAARVRRGVDEDRQRPPPAGQRTVGGPGRDPAARAAGRLVDHARQGQPGAVRVGQPGRRPGVRQRRHGHVRRVAGDPRAEHVPAGDGRRPARVGDAAGQRVPGVRRPVRQRHRGRRRTGPRATPSARRPSPPRSTRSSATPGPPSWCTRPSTSDGRSSTS